MGKSTMVLTQPMDLYINQSVAHSLGLPVSPEFLMEKLNQAEESKQDLQSQVYALQRHLLEFQHRLDKSKEEAVMNAVALRRQVAECQKFQGQCKKLSQQCHWLEDECSLYFKDREAFMEVADEAEERAAKAQDRSTEAERKVGDLLMEIDKLKQVIEQCKNMGDPQLFEETATLRSKVIQLEFDKSSLQNEVTNITANAKREIEAAHEQIAVLEQQKVDLLALLTTSNRAFVEQRIDQDEMITRQETISPEVSNCFNQEDRHLFGTSYSGSNIQAMDAEIFRSQGGPRFSEEMIRQLLGELQTLRQEVDLYRKSLEKAQVEVQILAEDNKELKQAIRNKVSSSISKGVKGGLSKLHTRVQGDSFAGENILRQPLVPLHSNSPECRKHHR